MGRQTCFLPRAPSNLYAPGVTMYGGSYVVNLFKQKVLPQKSNVLATVTLPNLFVTDSLTIFTAQIVHSHMY